MRRRGWSEQLQNRACFLGKNEESSRMNTSTAVSSLRVWVWAVRPRTLPLAAAAIILGYGLAAMHGYSRPDVFGLALLTALLLQVLSNLANDYGDAASGADTDERVGPARMVGSGLATPQQMFRAVILAVALALLSGVALVCVAAWGRWAVFGGFVALGAASVAAAVAYTMGKRPYGYIGLGDVMAGLFFGPVPVIGCVVLCGSPVVPAMWLPALAAGLCSTAVLNVNNMRDIETDRLSGKMTVAARLGVENARLYHAALAGLVVLLWGAFWLQENPRLLPGLVLALPLARSAWLATRRNADAACLNAQLRGTVLSSALLNTGMALLCLLNAP